MQRRLSAHSSGSSSGHDQMNTIMVKGPGVNRSRPAILDFPNFNKMSQQVHGRTRNRLIDVDIDSSDSVSLSGGGISLTDSIHKFRDDFEDLKCKMHIFGESLNLCQCIAADFKNKLSRLEKRLPHLAGAIMHSLNVSLINPGECQAKISQDYPHLLEQYDQESCACGQPTNPVNNICKVDTGSALACTTGDGHWVLRGVYSWDSGCQPGDQLAAFYKFDLEWYEWAIGLLESARFAQFSSSSSSQQRYTSGVKGGSSGGIKGGFQVGLGGIGGKVGFGQFGEFSSKFSEASSSSSEGSSNFGQAISGPVSNSFSASYSEKKVYQSEPKIHTFTTKPEIFTYTTKPEIVTFTTKPQLITYETSGSAANPQFVAPGVTFNPSFSEVVGTHKHNAACKCLDGKK